jgi:hypothetical protein
MLIVDTHCHALPHWFEPVEVLLHQMHANGVEKQWTMEHVAFCSEDNKAWLFGKTATSLFKFTEGGQAA